MRRLPVIAAGTARMVLPMSDRSAAVLAAALLSRDVSAIDELAAALALDPPLFFWTAHQHDSTRADGAVTGDCRTAKYLAAWLAENALAVLQWDDQVADDQAADEQAADEQEWADRVAAAVEEATAARLLADEGHQEQAYGDGLLRAAKRWLPREFSTADVQLSPVKSSVEGSEGIGEDARRRGLEARRRWLAPCLGAGCLPRLMSRLARLEELEKRFDETLLAEKLESMAEFAAGAGHEINNPLAVIAGRAQLFLQDETDPERRRALALMNAQAKRVYEMIADMMLFARPPAPNYQKVHLDAIIDGIISDLKPAVDELAVSLTRTGLTGPVEIEADAEQLNVALRALCRNSLEAMGHGGRIAIDVQVDNGQVDNGQVDGQADGQHAVIRVSDDGPGIPAEARRHIFDPFFSARQAGRGLGLGLAKCRRIVVTNHHGRIDVDSVPGRPTVFTITLPIRQRD